MAEYMIVEKGNMTPAWIETDDETETCVVHSGRYCGSCGQELPIWWPKATVCNDCLEPD